MIYLIGTQLQNYVDIIWVLEEVLEINYMI